MELSNNLVSKFAKLNNTNKDNSGELVYGTIVMQGSKLFVNIDGSDTITPVVTMSDVKPGERVTVMIKDHSATIMGNITNPSAGTEEMGKILDEYDTIIAKIGNFELIIADKVTTEQLDAELAKIDEALIGKATIIELEAVKATIEDLNVSKLEADLAEIEEAIIQKADIVDLDAINANIAVLESNLARVDTLVGGHLTMDNIQSLVLTTSKVTVDNAFIKDAMIDRVSASKLTAGTINTNLITIGSEDGSMAINGSLQQFKDADGNVRIQIGKDATGDFTFVLYGKDGVGQLINQNGITASAIEDGLIINDMVAENAAIAGNKLDIHSVVEEINDSTTTIKSSKIIFDDLGQTLDVAFNTLESKVLEGMVPDEVLEQITTNTTSIGVAQGQINTLISNTTITNENGETVSMKDDYSSFKQTVNGMSSKIGSLETTVDGATSKISTIEQTLNGFDSRIISAETNASSAKSESSQLRQSVDSFGVLIQDIETTTETLNAEVASLKLTSDEFEVEISKKTDKDNIISSINASTEGIKISSSKVNISGLVEFSDLSTPGSTIINAANITTGHISCDRLKGGTISAADEINFIGGSRIFGNEGELDAGLTISAAGINLGGGTINFLNGNWYLPQGKLELSDGDLKVVGDITLSSGKATINGSLTSYDLTTTSSAFIGGSLTVDGTMKLQYGSLWTPAGTASRDHLQLSQGILAYDSGSSKFFAINSSGDFIPIRGSRFEAGGDVTCWDLWAANKVYANNVALSSDKRLKTDIRYVNKDNQSIGESGLISPNVLITTKDMLEFIESIPFASYRMKNEVEKDIDYTYYGFIAQDLLETKVGSELIEYSEVIVENKTYDDEGRELIEYVTEERLRYSENKFIAFLAGAVQEDILQRKAADKELMNMLNSIINE